MSTKKENTAQNVGFKLSSKEVFKMASRRIGVSHAARDSEANGEEVAMKIFGTHTYSTSKQLEN